MSGINQFATSGRVLETPPAADPLTARIRGAAASWHLMPDSWALTAAVVAANLADARRVADVRERDGIAVTVMFTRVSDIALGGLGPRLDVAILTASVDEARTEAAVRQARGALHHPGIVVVCEPIRHDQLTRYLEAGADGLVYGNELDLTLAPVVRCTVAGQIAIPQSMRQLVAPLALSYREKQVLELAARGMTNRQIAGRLYLAESTVKTHMSSAFKRLGVKSRREASALICANHNHISRQIFSARPREMRRRAMTGGSDGRGPQEREQR
jgi:DNA-binding NarL/FixJ family response regulator